MPEGTTHNPETGEITLPKTKGTLLGYTNYKGKSGKVYEVPVLADGLGGQTRWLKDVLWADLPIKIRMEFAAKGGGLLCQQDLMDMWKQYGEWKKTGVGAEIFIFTEKPEPEE